MEEVKAAKSHYEAMVEKAIASRSKHVALVQERLQQVELHH
jgi:hypothetical protein